MTSARLASGAQNPVQYGLVLTLIVLELLLAFGVGVSCVLVSLHLLRKTYEEESRSERSLVSDLDPDVTWGRPSYSSVSVSELASGASGDTPGYERIDSGENDGRTLANVHSWLQRLFAW